LSLISSECVTAGLRLDIFHQASLAVCRLVAMIPNDLTIAVSSAGLTLGRVALLWVNKKVSVGHVIKYFPSLIPSRSASDACYSFTPSWQ
jgi:hypothetical protein